MPKKKSKKSQRHEQILDALRLDPAKRVNELALALNVSSETIRRDLAELDAKGSIRRTYGGAVRTSAREPALDERLKLYVPERERIARKTIELIADVDSLFVGGGATTLHFSQALKAQDRHLTVLTASLEVAMELATNPRFAVISLPGAVESKEGMVHGPETLRFISEYNVQAAIIGASAVDARGVTEALPAAADVFSAMIRQAEHTYIVADQSKLGKTSLKRILRWNANATLVTDVEGSEAVPTAAFQRVIQRAAIHVQSSGRTEVTGANVLVAVFAERESHAAHFLQSQDMTRFDAVNYISHGLAKRPGEGQAKSPKGAAEEVEGGTSKPESALESYCVDLNEKARSGKIDPLIGRDSEIERSIQVLCRRRKNNPILVGDPGVGKTAIAEGLAKRIVEGDVPEVLAESTIFALDMGALLAGTR